MAEGAARGLIIGAARDRPQNESARYNLALPPIVVRDGVLPQGQPAQVVFHGLPEHLCYQKMSSARMSRGETLVLVMQPAQDRPTHDLALAPGR